MGNNKTDEEKFQEQMLKIINESKFVTEHDREAAKLIVSPTDPMSVAAKLITITNDLGRAYINISILQSALAIWKTWEPLGINIYTAQGLILRFRFGKTYVESDDVYYLEAVMDSLHSCDCVCGDR